MWVYCLISDICSKMCIFYICLFDYIWSLNPSPHKGVGFELWYIETYFHTHNNESQQKANNQNSTHSTND